MSATSRSIRGTSARAEDAVHDDNLLRRLVATDGRLPGTVARLALGLVMFPHAAQKTLGWFGGYGFAGTYGFFTTKAGLPGVVAAAVIIIEIVSSLLLIFGALSRLGALGVAAIMLGAIATVHAPNGFFMNWNGDKAGEGFEYHLLSLGLALVVLIAGGGAASIDRALMRRLTSSRAAPGGREFPAAT